MFQSQWVPVHDTTAPDGVQGLPYVHCTPSSVQAVPSLGTTAGQPGVVGGPLQDQSTGGRHAGPPPHPQKQIELPYVHTSPMFEHTVPGAGSELPQSPGSMQAPPVVSQLPLLQTHGVRHSGRTELP